MSAKGFYGRRMVPEYLIKKLEKGPVKLKDITNITALTDYEINTLEAGDIVLKKTSNQYHAYIVSYKEDKQGICLTYTDASCIETVSYDYTDDHWIYNSTDVTLMSEKQDKLTAGTGIEIDEDNVISATGGGGSQLYQHKIKMYFEFDDSGTNFTLAVYFDTILSTNVEINTHALFDTYVPSGRSYQAYVDYDEYGDALHKYLVYAFQKYVHDFDLWFLDTQQMQPSYLESSDSTITSIEFSDTVTAL